MITPNSFWQDVLSNSNQPSPEEVKLSFRTIDKVTLGIDQKLDDFINKLIRREVAKQLKDIFYVINEKELVKLISLKVKRLKYTCSTKVAVKLSCRRQGIDLHIGRCAVHKLVAALVDKEFERKRNEKLQSSNNQRTRVNGKLPRPRNKY